MADVEAWASSSSSPAPWVWHTSPLSKEGMYDVFLNFRGEDTRFAFTDYLYYGLAELKKLQVFRDDPGLELGSDMKPALLEAIKRSRIHIVVMSENYLSSSWCLMELEEMLKYSNNGKKRLLVPIFYRVEPAEVRHQISEKSKKAMEDHASRVGVEKVNTWKSALTTVCGLTGQHILEKGNRNETELIGKIVEEVSNKLVEIKHQLKRFDYQFEVVESLLKLESCDNNVGMVGIYEDPTIGKPYMTKFAFELYYKIKYKFKAASFLVDVGKQLRKNTDNGLQNLQRELLSDMGVETMQELQNRRVLVVLEGVDGKEHLELLERERIGYWFGPGSRIIITAEDKNLFENCSPVMNGVKLETHCIREVEFVKKEIVKENEFVKQKIVMENDLVGFVKDTIYVINQLREEDSKGRNVVSIVGIPGSGKTTLARKVYNSGEVKKVFPCRAWATVSKDYREKEVLSSLFRSLMPSTPVPENEEELKRKVRGFLNGQRRKYLVVLDDVWDTQVWDNLKDYVLPNENNGSRILLTTSNHQVANHAKSKEPHHEPSRLNEEESWELFRRRVFWGEECPAELEPIGKSIAQSCKGLPLTIVTLAGVVSKRKRSKEEWGTIGKLIPHWFHVLEMNRMMKILKMSYDDLSEELKSCFRYLGVFPEDCNIKVRELIKLWMAEGFLQVRITGRAKEPPQPEDIGEDYLKELVDRNLVRVVRWRSDGEGVKTIQIHDLIRELCISESNIPDNNNNARRLLFFTSNTCSAEACDQSRTRSLFFYQDASKWSQYIPKKQLINVLYFSKWARGCPTRVKNLHTLTLKSLKYLKMELDDLHELAIKCPNLETLHLLMCPGSGGLSIWRLKQLRHLHTLVSVHLLVQEEVKDEMQNVQTLCYVYADFQLGRLLSNGYFPNLTTLGLYIPRGEEQQAKENLRTLRPMSKLRKLKLELAVVNMVPLDGIVFPSTLTKITLSRFGGFQSKHMNILGNIHSLQILKLSHGECTERTLNCGTSGSFPRLQVFIMIRVQVRKLASEEDAMPSLRRAVICECPSYLEVTDRMRSLGSNLEYVDHQMHMVDDD